MLEAADWAEPRAATSPGVLGFSGSWRPSCLPPWPFYREVLETNVNVIFVSIPQENKTDGHIFFMYLFVIDFNNVGYNSIS